MQSLDGIPLHFLVDILSNCSAKHLKFLEEQNPEVIPTTSCLWRALIIKDFTGASVTQVEGDWRWQYSELVENEHSKQERLKARLNIINKEEQVKKSRSVKVLERKPRISTVFQRGGVAAKKSKWQKLLTPCKSKPASGSKYMN